MAPRSSRRRFLTRGSQAVVGTSLLPFAGCSDSGPRARVPAGLIENVEAQIPALLAAARVPGLSIAIVRDGKLAWARRFGVKRSGTTDAVDERRRIRTFLERRSMTPPHGRSAGSCCHRENGDLLSHGDDNPGYKSFVLASMKRKTGYVMLTNGDNGGEVLSALANGDTPLNFLVSG